MSPLRRRTRMPGAFGAGGVRAWARRHAYSLLSSLGTLVRHPLASVMTLVVLAVTLSLPTGLYVTLDNVARISANWERLDTLSVFMHEQVDDEEAMQLASRWSNWPEVAAVDPISPAAGLEELGGQMQLGDLVSAIDDNPLPWVLEMTPAGGTDIADLAGKLRSEERVGQVIVDLQWLERLEAMLELLRQLTVLLAILFAIAVAFVVGNTIRLDIQNRHEEIKVMALVGATNGFVRRPFLYSGLWYGLIGSLLAWGVVRLGLLLLSGPVSQLSGSYGSDFVLQPPGIGVAALLVGGSGALGIIGSWLAVGRHLRRIHPA